MSLIPALEDRSRPISEFEACLVYIPKPCQKTNKKTCGFSVKLLVWLSVIQSHFSLTLLQLRGRNTWLQSTSNEQTLRNLPKYNL